MKHSIQNDHQPSVPRYIAAMHYYIMGVVPHQYNPKITLYDKPKYSVFAVLEIRIRNWSAVFRT